MTEGLVAHNISFQRPARGETDHRVLDRICVHLKPGQATLVQGATGAGKTTLLYLLANLMRPTEGEITADGDPVSRWTAKHRDRWRRRVGIAFQQARLLNHLTVLENIYLPLVPCGLRLSAMRQRGVECLALMGIAQFAGERPPSLSGGECQRVAVARALVSNPAYLLLDEPTAFQDNEGVALVCRAVERAKANGAAVFICSHDRRLHASELVDAAYCLEGGRLKPCRSGYTGISSD